MLRNKKVIYLLIPLNVLVWGFFIFRFYAAFHETDVPVSDLNSHPLKELEIKDSSVYKLSLDYKDPFLKDAKSELSYAASQDLLTKNAEAQNRKQVVAKPVQEPKPLPEIKYLGLIKNNTSGLSTALVSINGQSRLIKQSDAIDGIVFKTFNRDSLVARCGKERIVVRK